MNQNSQGPQHLPCAGAGRSGLFTSHEKVIPQQKRVKEDGVKDVDVVEFARQTGHALHLLSWLRVC